jgi:hypothetical protein
LKIAGRFFENHSTTDGFGAPIVAVGRSENARARAQYAFDRAYVSVTAILRFSGRNAELEFMDPLNRERITAAKHAFPLAADFDASIAMLIAREHPERLGFSRTMNPDAYADTTRLFRLQHFDPAKTPVIFVHGLQDTPAGWSEASYLYFDASLVGRCLSVKSRAERAQHFRQIHFIEEIYEQISRGRAAVDHEQIGSLRSREHAVDFAAMFQVDEFGIRVEALERRVLVIGIDRAVSDPTIFQILDEVRGDEALSDSAFAVNNEVDLFVHVTAR